MTLWITNGHESKLAENANVYIAVAELQRPSRLRIVGVDGGAEVVGVRDYGFEILDADDNVHLLSRIKMLKVGSAQGDGSLQRLLEYF